MSSRSIDIPGINIQYPWADLIVSGRKTIETRFYPLPEKWIGRPLAIIETPGKVGTFKRRVTGVVIFGESFKYPSLETFRRDYSLHLVSSDDPKFGWVNKARPKWGWPVIKVLRYQQDLPPAFRTGIRYSSAVPVAKLPSSFLEVPLV